jgi:hypothetical protein
VHSVQPLWNDEVEPRLAMPSTLAHGVEQVLGGRRLVGDDKHAGGF